MKPLFPDSGQPPSDLALRVLALSLEEQHEQHDTAVCFCEKCGPFRCLGAVKVGVALSVLEIYELKSRHEGAYSFVYRQALRDVRQHAEREKETQERMAAALLTRERLSGAPFRWPRQGRKL